jgi:hypothetical protein
VAAVFIERDLADVVAAVLDAPVPADRAQQHGGVGPHSGITFRIVVPARQGSDRSVPLSLRLTQPGEKALIGVLPDIV